MLFSFFSLIYASYYSCIVIKFKKYSHNFNYRPFVVLTIINWEALILVGSWSVALNPYPFSKQIINMCTQKNEAIHLSEFLVFRVIVVLWGSLQQLFSSSCRIFGY